MPYIFESEYQKLLDEPLRLDNIIAAQAETIRKLKAELDTMSMLFAQTNRDCEEWKQWRDARAVLAELEAE